MKSFKPIYIILFCLLAWFFSAPCSGSCSPTYIVTEEQISTLDNILSGLQEDNEKLQTLLNESTGDLTIAASESNELRTQLSEAQKQLTALKTQLTNLKNECVTVKTSLDKANEELRLASLSFKQSVKEHEKVESRLRTQRNIWEILCAIAVGVAVSR